MAPLPMNSIDHFTHPGHPLTAVDGGEQEFRCNGCRTLGTGKRYRCHGCDFDLHEYCCTCPRVLSSFMHPHHALALVMRKAQGARQVHRICNVCADPVEGLFYRCKECEFDVHPICTQLPAKLQHALHMIHPLDLQSPGKPGFCAVCRGSCGGWRYRCDACDFDIHLECILVPIVPCQQTNAQTYRGPPTFDQGVPFRPPPHFAPYYRFPNSGPAYPFGPGNYFPVYNPGAQYMNPGYFVQQNIQADGANKRRKSMIALVGRLGITVLSNLVFGLDWTPVASIGSTTNT